MRRQGFSLIETLVAVAIAAVSLTVLMTLLATGMGPTIDPNGNVAVARIVAEISHRGAVEVETNQWWYDNAGHPVTAKSRNVAYVATVSGGALVSLPGDAMVTIPALSVNIRSLRDAWEHHTNITLPP